MNPVLLIAIEGVLFALVFGGLSLVKKERLSRQFLLEVMVITLLGLAVVVAGLGLHPVLFLVVLYLVTMRARILVDLGNLLSSRGKHEAALAIYQLALRLRPDPAGRLSALINSGVAYLRQGSPHKAVSTLRETLNTVPQGFHSKYETACRYNLGLAYRRTGEEKEAIHQFEEVIRLFPNSLYARGAQTAIREGSQDNAQQPEEGNDE
jgi:tetratricopeptide (TPR) repeat protein